jgi:hypothetical protein
MKRLFALYRKLLLWWETRVVRCLMCSCISDRQFPVHARRIANNHARCTGHIVEVSRFGRRAS